LTTVKKINEYKIPKHIKKLISRELLQTFKSNLDEKFAEDEPESELTYHGFYIYLESTAGWKESFKEACTTTNSQEIYEYHSSLEEIESDIFDDEICLMLLEKGVSAKGTPEKLSVDAIYYKENLDDGNYH
jgi:hypothetical protein